MDDLEFIYKQFQSMEKRYHTWMNYYSLFNGALLVAYCTILVSTGEVVKRLCESGNAKYCLDCTYWGFLFIIALLGVIASYCWYLSMIGHNRWLNNWRTKLQNEKPEIMKSISGENLKLIKVCEKQVLPCFYSTAEITKFFIFAVLTAWSIMLFYTISKYANFHIAPFYTFLSGLSLSLVLYILKYVLFIFVGSNLNGFSINSKDTEIEKICICKFLSRFLCASCCSIIWEVIIFIATIILVVFSLNEGRIMMLLKEFGNLIMR